MKKLTLILFPLFLFINFDLPDFDIKKDFSTNQTKRFTVIYKSVDDLLITADVYHSQNMDAPWIILFHQAGYSRGEYREIAPKLNAMGFNCLAVDQRSGVAVNNVVNETHKEAVGKKMATKYPDAFPDLEASLLYAKTVLKSKKIIVWGSSYSASLVFILASKHKTDVAAIVAFSPGEYFTYEGKKIADFAADIDCPVFITSSASEHKDWKKIYEGLNSETKIGFLPSSKGFHGSKALWEEKTGNEEYWNAISNFLENQL